MKKWLSIVLVVCLLVAAIPFGMLSASAAAPVWIRGDDGTPVSVGDVIPKGVGVKVQGWVDGSGEQNILINGAGGMTTKGLFTFRSFAPLRIDALTPKLSVTAIYNINFDTDGGTLSNDNTYTVGGNEKFPSNLPTASKAGAEFLGWKYDGNLINANTKVGQYEYSSSVTLTASYEITEKVTGEDTWELNGTVLTISGNGAMADYPRGDAPWGKDITKAVISEGVTSIGANAFANSTKLTEVEIPSTVKNIHFITEDQLNSAAPKTSAAPAEITATAANLKSDPDSSAFKGCTALTKVTVATANATYASDSGIVYNKAKTQIIFCPQGKTGSYTILGTTKTIADWAFDNSKLSSIIIPVGVTTLGLGSFSACNNLTSIEVPKTVTKTTSYVFYNCEKLTTLTLHKELTSIGAMFAFGSPITDVYYDGTASQKSTLLGKINGLWTCIDYPVVGGKPDTTKPVTWHLNAAPPTGYTVSGTVTSKSNTNIPDGSVTITLCVKGSTDAVATATVTGTSGTYSLTGIAAGTYTISFAKPGHAKLTVEITVSSADVTQDAALVHSGDLSKNGSTDKLDLIKLKKHLNKSALLSGYDVNIGDLSGNGTTDKLDLTKFKKHINKSSYLY